MPLLLRLNLRALVAATVCLWTGACGAPTPPLAPPEPPTVTVAQPIEQELPSFTEFTGRLAAVETVEVRARVSGYLTKVFFKEGAVVTKGDPLYLIDPRPYEATAAKAEAEIASGKATLARAEADLARARSAVVNGAVSREDLDKAVASKLTAEAALLAAKAALQTAKLDIEFTRINAEVTGRISRTYITAGNLVSPGTSLLTRIVTINPIYAFFDVDELTSLWYRDQIHKYKTIPDPRGATPLRCWIQLKSERDYPHAGHVDYIDPQIDRTTGTRLIRAVFDNTDGVMTPGDSIRVRVEAGAARRAITITELAIGSQQKQKYVMVVNGQDEAEFRPVTLGPVRDGVQIVEEGLSPKDRVIVNGLLRVRPGMKVNPKPEPAHTPPASTAKAG